MRTHAPWLVALVILALLYNRLPLAAQPTPEETTWRGRLGDQTVTATLISKPDGERLTVLGAELSRLTATWIPVEGGGVILERDLRLEDGVWRSGPLALAAGRRWQVLLTATTTGGDTWLVTSDWVRGDDGVLRPEGVAPGVAGTVIGLANRWGPACLLGAGGLVCAGWLWRLVRGIQRKQPQAG